MYLIRHRAAVRHSRISTHLTIERNSENCSLHLTRRRGRVNTSVKPNRRASALYACMINAGKQAERRACSLDRRRVRVRVRVRVERWMQIMPRVRPSVFAGQDTRGIFFPRRNSAHRGLENIFNILCLTHTNTAQVLFPTRCYARPVHTHVYGVLLHSRS